MSHYLYQNHRGHILVRIEGSHYLLDTGTPFSVGHGPILINGRAFPTDTSYLGITPAVISQHLGLPVEGLIGTDILRQFNLAVYAPEGLVQFSQQPALGGIVLPVSEHAGVPVVSLRIADRVCRMFLDTGSAVSLLLPGQLQGVPEVANVNAYYPLIGRYATGLYRLQATFGHRRRSMLFGEVPDPLLQVIVNAGIQGVIGTELLMFYGFNLSLRERVIRLEVADSAGEMGLG